MRQDSWCTECASALVRFNQPSSVPDFMPLSAACLLLPSRGPLLCPTASIIVQERPVPLTLARSVLADMLAEAGGQSPTPARPDSLSDAHKRDNFCHGLDKVNLLRGCLPTSCSLTAMDLSCIAPSFVHAPSPFSLPGTRTGVRTHRREFVLPPSSTPLS